MTTIYCDRQDCLYNKYEKCTLQHINLLNIKSISQHFWFACLSYSKNEDKKEDKNIYDEEAARKFF